MQTVILLEISEDETNMNIDISEFKYFNRVKQIFIRRPSKKNSAIPAISLSLSTEQKEKVNILYSKPATTISQTNLLES